MDRRVTKQPTKPTQATESISVDWYHEGDTRSVEFNGVNITVRYVVRKGRRARIAIMAPAGAVFREAMRRN